MIDAVRSSSSTVQRVLHASTRSSDVNMAVYRPALAVVQRHIACLACHAVRSMLPTHGTCWHLQTTFVVAMVVMRVHVSADPYERVGMSLTAVPVTDMQSQPYTIDVVDLHENDITGLPDGTFSTFPDVTDVLLTNNQVSTVHANALCGTVTFKLQLNYNLMTSFPDLSCVAPTLREVYLGWNLICSVSPTVLQGLSLEYLKLAGNCLASIPDLSPISHSLVTLDLDENQITHVGTELENFQNLLNVELEYNQIQTIHPHAFNGTILQLLRLRSNNLTPFPDLADVGDTLFTLILNENPITDFSADLSQVTALKTLELKDCGMTSFPQELCDSSVGYQLRRLYLQGNAIDNIDTTADGCTEISKMYFQENQMTSFPLFGDQGTRLNELDLSNSNFSDTVLVTGTPGLGYLSSLTILLLRETELSDWAQIDAILDTGTNLRTLDLGLNYLDSVDPRAFNLPELNTLNLESNQITCLPTVSTLSNNNVCSIDYNLKL